MLEDAVPVAPQGRLRGRYRLASLLPATRGLLYGLGAGALVVGAADVWLASTVDHWSNSPRLIALWLVVGWSFAACAILALHRRPEHPLGLLLAVTGLGWFATTLSDANWAIVFTAGLVLVPVYKALLIHLLLAFPSGRLETRSSKWIAGAAYVNFLGGQLLFVLVTDPNERFGCECPDNLLLVGDRPEAARIVIEIVQPAVGVVLAALTLATLFRRWRAASPPLRRAITPVLAFGSLTVVLIVSAVVADDLGARATAVDLRWASFISLAFVPLAFLAGLLRIRLARAAVGDLVLELRGAATPGDVQAAVALALRDPSLKLAYRLAEDGRFVDADGQPFDLPGEGTGRGVRMVEYEGRQVAALVYDGSLEDERELVDAVAATAAMALENARLQAELSAHLVELRASQARVLEAGDAERQRLERDLHDGAQQRFVTLSLALSAVEKRLASDPAQAGQLLTEARKELVEGLDELRELAHGIHPAALSQRGLGVAVETLAARSPVPVTLDVTLHQRLPEPVEIAGYFVVSEALTNVAKYAQASAVIVALARTDETLVVEVRDNGIGGAKAGAGSGLRGLTDRVEALGGQLSVRSPAGGGTTVRAEIPCA
jgi:signal transduction histidine kinase